MIKHAKIDLSTTPDLKPGTYDVRVAMINTTTNKIKYIRLAIKGKDEMGRYKLGTVKIY